MTWVQILASVLCAGGAATLVCWFAGRDRLTEFRRPKAPVPPLPRRHGVPPGHPEQPAGPVGGHLWTWQQQLWPHAEYQQIIDAGQKHREQK